MSKKQKQAEEISEKKEHKIESPYFLVVKSPFRNYQKGDQISDPQEVINVLACHEGHMVVKSLKN